MKKKKNKIIFFLSIIIIILIFILIIISICSVFAINSISKHIGYFFDKCNSLDVYEKKNLIKNISFQINSNHFKEFNNELLNELFNFFLVSQYLKESEVNTLPPELDIKNKNFITNIFYTFYNKSILIRYYEKQNDDLIITIRGTKTLNEFILDSFIDQNTINDFLDTNIKCHSGFLKIYDSILDDYNFNIKRKNYKNIYLIGHSLGGSLVNILSYKTYLHNKNSIFITIGTPRTCNESFFNLVSQIPIYRIINEFDYIITIIPPFSKSIGNKNEKYKDIGKTYKFFANNGCITANHSYFTYFKNKNNLFEDVELNKFNYSIKNNIDYY